MELKLEIVDRPGRKSSAPRKQRGSRARRTPRIPVPRTFECANCGEVFVNPMGNSKTYCSLACSSQADAVRSARSAFERYGEDLPEDVDYGLKMKRAHALGGGYDKAARRLSPERRAEVMARDKGLCVSCGEPGVETDHIDGSSDEIWNLRLLCVDYHHEVTDARLVLITDSAVLELRDDLFVRILSPEPLYDCDVPGWDWRTWTKAHER